MRDRLREALATHRAVEQPLADRRAAGVLLLLQPIDGVDHVVFQHRTHNVRHHKGEISLPGGTREPGDATLLHTALRETHEEIGLPSDCIEVIGQLDDTVTKASNYLVRPYAGVIAPGAGVTVAEPREVRALLHVPFEHLLAPGTLGWYAIEDGGVPLLTPAYWYEEHAIWGATARILGACFTLLGAPPLPDAIPAEPAG
jgi:8-oxo-dGTP pyrophosphatase MutT (NUDIX family)